MRLFYRLFQIISGCLHTENANVQTAILNPFMQEWLVGVDEECLHICIDWKARRQNGKLPDGAFWYYYTHYFLLYALFVLAEQDCCPCKYVLRTVFLCTSILWEETLNNKNNDSIGSWGQPAHGDGVIAFTGVVDSFTFFFGGWREEKVHRFKQVTTAFGHVSQSAGANSNWSMTENFIFLECLMKKIRAQV